MNELGAFQKRFVRGALAPGTDTLLYDAIVTALGKPGSPMKDRPVTVRLLYGATDEQVAERMAPARHAIQASVAFPPVSAEVVVNLENHPTSSRTRPKQRTSEAICWSGGRRSCSNGLTT